MKCMCNFCECGQHQCRKFMPSAPPPTGKEEPLKDSEYKTQFHQKERSPVGARGAPQDNLKNDGEFDGMTTTRAGYPKHEGVKPITYPKPAFQKRTSSMDLNTEYVTKFQQRKGERAPKPGFYRSKTQPYSIGVANPERSVTQVDFQRSQNPAKQGILRPTDNLDRQGPIDLETTTRKTFVPHSASKNVAQRPQDTYTLPSSPFAKETTVRNSYRPFSNAHRASPIRFQSEFPYNKNEPVWDETTSKAAYQKLTFSRHIVGRIPDSFEPPSNERAFQKTSDDYKGMKGRASTPLKRIDNIAPDGPHDFDTTTHSVYKKHDSQRPKRPLWQRASNLKPSDEPFSQLSENHEQFQQPNSRPAFMSRPSDGIIIPNEKFTTDSSYKKDYEKKGRIECQTDKIIANGYKGYDIHDDFDKKHRFLIKRESRKSTPVMSQSQANLNVDIEVIHD